MDASGARRRRTAERCPLRAPRPTYAGARETLEETGWQPGPLAPMFTYFPHNGTGDMTFNLFVATSATHVGDPADPDESERVEWLPWDTVRSEIAAGRIGDGVSLTGLLYRLAQI